MSIKIEYSTQAVWWNTGNEVKPNREALNTFTWVQATNFNVNWVDETHINVVVPQGQLIKFIRITDDNENVVKYYYLLEVRNKTIINSECIFELDVWVSYLLPYLESTTKLVKSIRTLDVSTVANTINIEPIGVPTGRIVTKQVSFSVADKDNLFRNTADRNKTPKTYKCTPGLTTNLYYVFKAKQPVWSSERGEALLTALESEGDVPQLHNYVLIPVLNLADYGLSKEYTAKTVYARTPNDIITATEGFRIMNSQPILENLVNVYSNFGNNGIGEFIGIWVGPNYFRIKEKGIRTLSLHSTLEGNSWKYKWYTTQDIIFRLTAQGFKYLTETTDEWGTLLAIKVDAMPVGMEPLGNTLNKQDFLTGFKYQENADNNIVASAAMLSFNQGFNYSNGWQTSTINMPVPVGYDGYYNLLQAQRNTLNTSLALSGVNSALSSIGALTGLVPPKPSSRITETIKDKYIPGEKLATHKEAKIARGPRGGQKILGWDTQNTYQSSTIQALKTTSKTIGLTAGASPIGVGMSIASAGLQFASTLAEQQAYREDLRRQTSAAVLNENDKYVNWFLIASAYNVLTPQQTNGLTVTQFLALICKENISGAETAINPTYYFYGVECQPQVINMKNTQLETYLQVDDNTSLVFQLDWGNKYTPTIKAGMLSLLIEGIRISGGNI